MSNRCPSCNKFVGLEAAEPEPEDPEVDGTETVAVTQRVVLCCTECGEEIKEWNAELSADIEGEAGQHAHDHEEAGEEFEISADWVSPPEVGDEFRPRKKPKPSQKTGKIKPVPYRYQVHYYKISGEIVLTCSCGEDLGTITVEDEIEASGFEELN